jgi:hypothetical protein
MGVITWEQLTSFLRRNGKDHDATPPMGIPMPAVSDSSGRLEPE